MRTMRKWLSGFMMLSIGLAAGAQAETIALYTFTGNTNTPAEANAFVDASPVTASTGTVAYGTANGATWLGSGIPYLQSAGGWTASDQATAKHFLINIAEMNGATFSVTNISLRRRATNAGPSAFGVSVNGTAVYSESLTNNSTALIDIPLSGLEDLEAVEIRIQGWLDGSRTTTGGGELHIDDLLVQGVVVEPVGQFPPSIGQPSSSAVTEDSVILSANISSTGGLDVDERGFVYSTTSGFDPSSAGASVFEDDGEFGIGIFSLPVADLTPNTTYYFFGYAKNSEGTSFTSESSFTTLAPPPSDLLAYYAFDGNSPNATFSSSEITAAALTVSTGTLAYAWVGPADWEEQGAAQPYIESTGGWNAGSQAAAKYFEIVLTADTTMTITNISFLQRRTAAGPDTTGVSINGASVYSNPLVVNTVVEVVIPVTGFAGVESATIRLQGWGTTTGGGVWRIDNVLIQGTLGDDPVDPDPALSLLVPASIEQGTSATGTVSVIGPFDAPLEIDLASSLPASLSVSPATVTISEGQTNASFTLTAAPITAEGPDVAVTVSASADEYEAVSAEITVLNTFRPPISLTEAGYSQDFAAFVSAATLPTGWSVSGAVVAYAGTWGTGTGAGLRGNASILGYQHTAATGIFDKLATIRNDSSAEITALEISYRGRVERVEESRPPAYAVTVGGQVVAGLAYSTEDGNDNVLITATVTGLSIPVGDTFDIVWRSERGGTAGSSRQIGISDFSINISGDDPGPDPDPELVFDIPESVEQGTSVTGTVSVTGSFTAPLEITLVSSIPASLTVPGSVLIEEGQTSAEFTVTATAITEEGDDFPVSITANAAGFAEISTNITVLNSFEEPGPGPEQPGPATITLFQIISGIPTITAGDIEAGAQYDLQTTTDLNDPNSWTNINGVVSEDTDDIVLDDDENSTDDPVRFYRIISPVPL
jgi:hypothetical protein